MQHIIQYDIELFYTINKLWTNSFFDFLLPLLRNQFFWAPLYLFLLVFMLMNFKKRGAWWLAMFLLTFAMSDMLSSSVIKPWVERLRPCNDPSIKDNMRLLVRCGAGYSFTSSHAANHFSLGMFSFLTLRFVPLKWRWLFLFWAFSIAYSQIYVGVHYPFDILGGAILGSVCGLFTSTIYKNSLNSLRLS